jgi:hypothetical protein
MVITATYTKIEGREPMYNAVPSFYVAQVVVLVCVKSPSEYCCVILPVNEAERAAQLNLDHAYRKGRLDGAKKKPGKVWVSLDYVPQRRDASRLPILREEQEILRQFMGKWEFVAPPLVCLLLLYDRRGKIIHRAEVRGGIVLRTTI